MNPWTWALGVYHGLRRQHRQSYLDEFVFRFNRRRSRHADFRSLLARPKTPYLQNVDRAGASGIIYASGYVFAENQNVLGEMHFTA